MNCTATTRSVLIARVLGAICTAFLLVGCESGGSLPSEESAKKVFIDQGIVKTSPIDQTRIKDLPVKLVAFKKTAEEEQERQGDKYHAVIFEADFEWTKDLNNPDDRDIYERALGMQRFGGRKGEPLSVQGAVVYVLKDNEWRVFGAFSEPHTRPRAPDKR